MWEVKCRQTHRPASAETEGSSARIDGGLFSLPRDVSNRPLIYSSGVQAGCLDQGVVGVLHSS